MASKTASKTASKKKPQQKKKPEQLVAVLVVPTEIKVGDEIVTAMTEDGVVKATMKVEHVWVAYDSCKNVHINRNQCYNRWVSIKIGVPLDDHRLNGHAR